MSKPVDKWPKRWKRPFYGPDVIARRFIAAGHKLLKEQAMSKSVEGKPIKLVPLDITVEEIIDLCPGCEMPKGKTHAVYIDHRNAGFKHAAFEGCQQCSTRIARRIREGVKG